MSLEWSDSGLAASLIRDDKYALVAAGRTIGEIVVYPSFPGAWQRIHGYADDEKLWSFDVEIFDEADRGRGFGTRAVRRTCESVLRSRDATRCIVDVRADNPRAISAYERAGFTRVRFLPNHDDGDGDVADAWLMEFDPRAKHARSGRASPHP